MAPTVPPLGAEKTLTILHFNDVYNVESSMIEPVGGAARFCTAIKSMLHLNPLILFSGDIFAPSFSNYKIALFYLLIDVTLFELQ